MCHPFRYTLGSGRKNVRLDSDTTNNTEANRHRRSKRNKRHGLKCKVNIKHGQSKGKKNRNKKDGENKVKARREIRSPDRIKLKTDTNGRVKATKHPDRIRDKE